jgi:hypothetical protein
MLALLMWRLPDVHWRDLGPRWSAATPWWLVGAAGMLLAAQVASAMRWRAVLVPMLGAGQKAPAPRSMISHTLAGQFVSNVLPTAFGGDVVRISRLGRELDDRPRAFASVTLDRLTGWLVLPAISLTALAVQPSLHHLGGATTTTIATAVVTLAALCGTILAASNRRFARHADGATGWRAFLVAVHLAIDALRTKPSAIVALLGSGFGFQLAQCVSVWMVARAIGLDEAAIGPVLVFFPATAILQNIPLGLGGLGVRESAFALFFGALGAPRALAVTLGLIVFLLTILTSAAGAPSFVVGPAVEARSRRPRPRADRDSIDTSS